MIATGATRTCAMVWKRALWEGVGPLPTPEGRADDRLCGFVPETVIRRDSASAPEAPYFGTVELFIRSRGVVTCLRPRRAPGGAAVPRSPAQACSLPNEDIALAQA
jgi:hypothetical protein